MPLINTLRPLAALCMAAAVSGCAYIGPCKPPQETTKFTVGNTERFVALDSVAEAAVSCTGLQERTLADGKLDVVANVKNLGPAAVNVEISCDFLDENGTPAGERPWRTISIAGNATEVVRFTAPSTAARRYSIRVRQKQ
jgi:hypothetical protein